MTVQRILDTGVVATLSATSGSPQQYLARVDTHRSVSAFVINSDGSNDMSWKVEGFWRHGNSRDVPDPNVNGETLVEIQAAQAVGTKTASVNALKQVSVSDAKSYTHVLISVYKASGDVSNYRVGVYGRIDVM